MINALRKLTTHALIAALFGVCMILPALVNAQDYPQPGEVPGNEGVTPIPTDPDTGISPIPSETSFLENPLKFDSIEGFLLAVIDVILVFALPLIVLFIMYAGFKFVFARGNESEVTKARTQLTWAVVGGLIVLGAKVILEVIQGTVETFEAGS